MRGMHDVADLTSSLVEWAQAVCPQAKVQAASTRVGPPGSDGPRGKDRILLRLTAIEALNGGRSRGAVASFVKLQYRFELDFADAAEEHQALADLAFALLERDDLAEGEGAVLGEQGSIRASFLLERKRALPRARPVREAMVRLQPTARISGQVQAENGFPITRAQLQIRNSDQLIVTGHNGEFAFEAPEGFAVRATVTAKGRTADVELKPGAANVITLAMES